MTDARINNPGPIRRTAGPWALSVGLMAIVYFISGKLVFSAAGGSLENSIVSPLVFVPEGIALAAVILWGRNLWPGIFLGQFLLATSAGMSPLTALGISAVNSLEAYIGATLFGFFRLNRKLDHIRDILGLLGLIIAVLQPFSAVFGNLVLLAASTITLNEYFSSTLAWWFGNSVAQILFTPMLLLLYAEMPSIKLREPLFIILLFALLNHLLLVILSISSMSMLLTIMLPLVTLIAVYKSVAHAIIATTVIALTTVYATHLGVGAFSGKDIINNVIDLNFYILSQTFLVLIIGTLFREKRRNEQQLLKNNIALQKSAALREQVDRMTQHDLKSPLNVLIHLPAMIQGGEPSLSQESRSLLSSCQEAAYKMLEMINRSLDLYKMETGSYDYRPESVDLIPILRQVLEDCHSPDRNTRGDLTNPLSIQDSNLNEVNTLWAWAEELLCYSLFSNLIRNALEASPDNIVIRAERKNRNQTCVVTIINRGEVPATIRDRFFDKMVTAGKQSGVGLGTYSARLCAEVQNGTISLDCSHHGETWVSVSLPADPTLQTASVDIETVTPGGNASIEKRPG